MRLLARTFALAPLALVVTACGMTTPNSESCDPGDYLNFTLPDGGAGFYRCLGDGSVYALYNGPDPNTLPDANFDAGGCVTANGKIGFLCPGCTVDGDCGEYDGIAMNCVPFPNKGGNLCSPACDSSNASTLCVAPSAGCGNNGHCKP